jgi:AraC family transcriptional regulator
LETRIIERNSFSVVGMTLSVLLKDERENKYIPKMHDQFEERISEIANRKNDHAVGIFIDPPNYDYTMDEFKWIAGVEVTEEGTKDIPDGMEIMSFPSNIYACTTYRGSKNETYKAYEYLYQWVEKSEYEIADSYGVEEALLGESNENERHFDLMLPVKKKQ